MKLRIPYNKIQMNIEIQDANFQGVLESHPADCIMEGTEQEIVERALDNPIGSPSLEELAKGKKNVVIISSDHTRPVPSHVTMPILLDGCGRQTLI